MTPETVTHIIIGTFGFILTGLVGMVVWLLQRLIRDIDAKFDAQNAHLHNQDGKLDALAASRSAHGESIVEMRVRLAGLEAERVEIRRQLSDWGGFMAALGYRFRDGEGSGGGK